MSEMLNLLLHLWLFVTDQHQKRSRKRLQTTHFLNVLTGNQTHVRLYFIESNPIVLEL